MKPRKFKLHFNRVNMQRKLPSIWTVHFSDRCVPLAEGDVRVPLRTVFRPDKKDNPRAWLEGRGVLLVEGDKGVIMEEVWACHNCCPYEKGDCGCDEFCECVHA